MAEYVEAPAFLQVEPDFNHYAPADTPRSVGGARVVAVTQSRPKQPRRGVLIVKVTLRIPKGAFLPLRPEAVVIVPEALTEAVPVEVEAVDPEAVTS